MNNKLKFINNFMLCVCLSALLGCERQTTIVHNNPLYYSYSWATLSYGLGAYDIVCSAKTYYNFFDGDSIFNNSGYKKMYCYRDEQHSTLFYEGLVREENSKIFFVPKDSTMEYLLYDFSLMEGTSFEYTHYYYPQRIIDAYVKQVDYVNINGNNLKQIKFSFLPPYDYIIIETWIESIGSMEGFLYPFFSQLITGGRRILLCCTQNDTLVYQNSQFSSCYYDNAEEVQNLLNTNNQ